MASRNVQTDCAFAGALYFDIENAIAAVGEVTTVTVGALASHRPAGQRERILRIVGLLEAATLTTPRRIAQYVGGG